MTGILTPETAPTLVSVMKTRRKNAPRKETLGERIRRFRQARRMTQAELAQRIGVSRRAEIYYEAEGGSPSPELLLKLAGALGVTMEALAGSDKTFKCPPMVEPANPRLWRRLRRIEELPPHDRKTILKMIDAMADARRKAS